MKKGITPICLLLLLVGLLTACSVEPKSIPYGQANCAHCSMTVSDTRFGAELVNDKGKAIFFDSGECLAAFLNDQPDQQKTAAFVMVSDFSRPGQLIEAGKAYFLRSKALPSPMGMHLTAVAEEATARKMQQEHGGNLLQWDQVLEVVKNNERLE
jgi:copper chaperone NosL